MNLFDAFKELDDSYLQEDYKDRQELIADIKSAGYNYKFEKYSDAQLFRIWQKSRGTQNKQVVPDTKINTTNAKPKILEVGELYCPDCGRRLTTMGECPVCDLGDESVTEDLYDGVFNNAPSGLTGWKTDTGTAVNTPTAPQPITQSQPAQPTQATKSTSHPTKNLVVIFYDNAKHKLRAMGDDGIHGVANVAFPNSLRNKEGQIYEVDELIWNGKNYRVSGNIRTVNTSSSQQNNVIEHIQKENEEMNLTNVFEELNRLYEADETAVEEVEDEVTEVPEEEVVEEPAAEEEAGPTKLVLECSKCGALVIKNDTDVTEDKESGLVNVGEACEYCEKEDGFNVVGTMTPYETTAVEEGLETCTDGDCDEACKKPDEKPLKELFGFGKNKKKKNSKSNTSSSGSDDGDGETQVSFKVYDEYGRLKFARDFVEFEGKRSAEEQFKDVFKNDPTYTEYLNSRNRTDWTYDRKSNPPSPFDSQRYNYNHLGMHLHL